MEYNYIAAIVNMELMVILVLKLTTYKGSEWRLQIDQRGLRTTLNTLCDCYRKLLFIKK